VHRDLKPENIMFADERCLRPVMIDFGTAGLFGRKEQLTNATLLAGSFHYMAPERLTGHYSPATDIYALGVIALEVLTGKRLHDIGVPIGDAALCREICRALEARLGVGRSAALAGELVSVFHAGPQQRPPDIRAWSGCFAALLETA
jgi:serine/threonine protein kinase